jgi:insulysin
MVEFFNSFLHPSSKQRSRVSVHLHARGAVERDGKVASVLEENGFTGVPYEDRQSLDILEAFLTKEHKTSESDLETIIAKVKELGVSKAAQTKDSETPSTMNGVSAVDTAVEIKDIRKYKGALLASSGARPVRELSEFEDNDPKL